MNDWSGFNKRYTPLKMIAKTQQLNQITRGVQIKRLRDKIVSFILVIFFFRVLYWLAPATLGFLSSIIDFKSDFVRPVVVYLSSSIIANIATNSFYWTLYNLQIPYFENKRCNQLPWPWQSDPVGWKQKLKRLIWVYTGNVYIFPVMMLFFLSSLFEKVEIELDNLPSFSLFCFQIYFVMLVDDFCNYWVHRLVHTPGLYRFHKFHHQEIVCINLSSGISHPVEVVYIESLISIFLQFIIGNSMHPIGYFSYSIYRVWLSEEIHCGYQFDWTILTGLPFSATTSHHDYHNTVNRGNFSLYFTIWDDIFKTYRFYNQEKKIN